MKFDFTKIALLVLVIAVIVLGYGIFKTKKWEDNPDTISNKIAIQQLNNDKVELNKQVSDLLKKQDDYFVMLKGKEAQIQSKEVEIKHLQKKLYEKIDAINHLDNNGNFLLFSNWLSENN